jgi:hypothetical protein
LTHAVESLSKKPLQLLRHLAVPNCRSCCASCSSQPSHAAHTRKSKQPTPRTQATVPHHQARIRVLRIPRLHRFDVLHWDLFHRAAASNLRRVQDTPTRSLSGNTAVAAAPVRLRWWPTVWQADAGLCCCCCWGEPCCCGQPQLRTQHTLLRTAAETSPALIRDLPTPVLAPHTQTDGSCRGTCTLASLLLHRRAPLLVGLCCCPVIGSSSDRTRPLRCLERAVNTR